MISADFIEGLDFEVSLWSRILIPLCHLYPVLGFTQSHNQRIPGAISSGSKRPGSETENLPLTIAEAKKIRIYASTHAYVIMELFQLVKYRAMSDLTLSRL
jgi:hypothetical protein